MVRTIVIPDTEHISFDIPKHYIGKQIEVIAFEQNEGANNQVHVGDKKKFAVIHVDHTDYKFSRDDANER
jgi:MOSC domain-containing protein YiiM